MTLLLKDQERSQLDWNRRARDTVNALVRRLLGVGATGERPAGPTDGQMYYDTDLKGPVWWSAADGKWYGDAGPSQLVTVTANHTVAVTEDAIINNKTGSTMTLTLPAAASYPGREITVKTLQVQTVVSATSNVAPIGSATLGTAILAATAGAWARLKSDGAGWVIMERGT